MNASDTLSFEPLSPFGMQITASVPQPLTAISPAMIHELMRAHRVLVFRGFEPLEGDDFPLWCARKGDLLDWEFGTVNTLKVDDDKKNYLYTQSPVPMHWDGAFLHTPPHYIVFHCDHAEPGCGGATTFTDTPKLLAKVSPEELAAWDDINATYITEKVVHYGGDFMSAILGEHPVTGEQTLRYAEPVNDLNPVKVFLHGIPVEQHAAFIEQMRQRLYDPDVLYAHDWLEGDVVMADNHALLHGRFALDKPGRRIRRVNIMTADFDADGNWVPPLNPSAKGIEGVKVPQLTEKIEKMGQGMLAFKRESDDSAFPNAFAAYVRSHGEIYHWPSGGFHVINRYEDARAILTSKHFTANRATFFVAKMPNVDLDLIGDFFGLVARMMVMSDGKVHTMRRRSALYGINREFIESFTPRIEATVNRLLDPLEATGEMEFVTEVARVLPAAVLADMFGIPEEDREFFRQCSNIMTAFFGGAVEYTNEIAIECNAAACAIREYFRKVVEARRAAPQNDFITGMLEAQAKYNLTDDELISQATMMLVAGQVTTTDQLCNNLFLMLDTPGVYQRLVDEPELMRNAQEEFNRFDPAVNFIFRVAKERQIINGQRIDAGDTVFMAGHVVNRDPTLYDDPDVVRIDRENPRHLGFGHGAHFCIGAGLGRLQMEALFGAMTRRFPNLRFTPGKPPKRDHYSLSFSGFAEIHLSK